MEFTDIKIFKAVADLKSTVKAAEALGYVQSNISKRIAKLEEEVGKSLFLRDNKGMSLTAEGEQFLPYAETLLRTIAELEENFIAKPKKVTIGATQTITKNYLQKHFFSDQFVIFTVSSAKLIQQLRQQQLDMILLNRRVEDGSFKRTMVKEEKIFWTISSGNKQALESTTIVMNRDLDCPYRQATLAFLKQKKLSVSCIEVDTFDVLITMLENYQAAAVLPETSIQLNERLQKLEEYELEPISIYQYQLKDTVLDFQLELAEEAH